jgi:hypothetical protein
MDTAVSFKTARRRGVTKENIPRGSLTEEKRSRRRVFNETLGIELLIAFLYAPPFSKDLAAFISRFFLKQSRIASSSGIQIFSTDCLGTS